MIAVYLFMCRVQHVNQAMCSGDSSHCVIVPLSPELSLGHCEVRRVTSK